LTGIVNLPTPISPSPVTEAFCEGNSDEERGPSTLGKVVRILEQKMHESNPQSSRMGDADSSV
jgi:hypothetical protein